MFVFGWFVLVVLEEFSRGSWYFDTGFTGLFDSRADRAFAYHFVGTKFDGGLFGLVAKIREMRLATNFGGDKK